MKKYLVRLTLAGYEFDEDVYANNKTEAYEKAKKRLAKKLFKESNLKRYSCDEF
ncbi:MAG: hypothetical protein J5732_02830 [Bacteroidaceae bacterium]|nr:hypothetical protein [Bacteroidaceae bacterium]